jgi:hypothetical protein
MMGTAITQMPWTFAVIFISFLGVVLAFVAMWFASHHHS